MRIHYFFLVFFLVWAESVLAQVPSEEALFQKAQQLFSKYQFAEALTVLEPACRQYPENILMGTLQAKCFLKLNEPLQAAESVSRFSATSEKQELNFIRAEIAFRLSCYQEVLHYLRANKQPEGESLRGQTYLKLEKYDLAYPELKKASERVLERTAELKLALCWAALCRGELQIISSLLIGLRVQGEENALKLAALFLAIGKKQNMKEVFPFSEWSEEVQEFYLKNYTKLAQGQIRSVLTDLSKSPPLRLEQKDPFQILEAKAFLRSKESFRARQSLNLCSGIRKQTFGYLQLMAQTFIEEGNMLEAVRWYDQALEQAEKESDRFTLQYQQLLCLVELPATPTVSEMVKLRFQNSLRYFPDSPELLFIQSQWAYKTEDYKTARKALQYALQMKIEEEPKFLYHLGKIDYELGEYEEAETCFKSLIQQRPESYLGYYYLGEIAARRKQFESAQNYFEQALSSHPKLTKIHLARAIAYFEEGDIFKAKSLLEVLSVQQGESVDNEVLFYQAKIFQSMGALTEALELFFRVVDVDPINTKALAGLAECLLNAGQIRPAIDLLNKTLRLDPELSNAYIQRGIAYTLLTKELRLVFALDSLKNFVEESAEWKSTLLDIGFYLSETTQSIRQEEEAQAFIRFLQSIFPENTFHINNIRFITLNLRPGFTPSAEQIQDIYKKVRGVYQKNALDDFNEGIRLAPEDPLGYTNRAGFYNGQHQLDLSVQDLQKALELGGKSPFIYYNLACNYALAGKKDEAFQMLEKSIEAGFKQHLMLERDDELQEIRSDVRFQKILNDLKAILAELNLSSRGEDPQLMVELAWASLQAKDQKQALNYLEQALLKGFRKRLLMEQRFSALATESLFQAYKLYLEALEAIELEQRESSLLLLEKAVQSGLPIKFLSPNTVLEPLENEPSFQKLLQTEEKKE